MKAGIGLIGVLIAVAIVFYVAFGMGDKGGVVGNNLRTGKELEKQANEFSGRDVTGQKATDSLTFDTDNKGVKVLSVVPKGAFDTKYGLQPGDVITQIGSLPREQISSNTDAAAYLHDAYRASWDLAVNRNGKSITLPRDRNVGLTPSQSAQPTTPPPATPQPERKNPVGKMQDLKNQIETH